MMRRSSVFCLIFFQIVLAGTCFGRTHTGKTFLLPQPMRFPTQHIFYDYCHDLFSRHKNLLGGNFQVTSFCRRDQNRKEIGQYFGRHESNVISIGTGVTDFQSSNLVFTPAPTLKGTLELRPHRKIRGLHFSYLHRLKTFSKRLFVNVSFPIIHVTRRMDVRVCDEVKQSIGEEKFGILDYFSGRLFQRDIQAPLQCAKIAFCKSQGKTDFGDIEATLSYQFNKNDRYYLRSSIGVLLPTSNRAKGQYLFDIITGHARHWGFLSSIEAMAILYQAGPTKVTVTHSATLKYCLENNQRRTISFRSDDIDSRRSWAHYYGFLGEHGKRGVFPGANVLTRDVHVTPGLIFDFIVNYNLFHRDWLCSFGYNFFSRSEEAVRPPCWEDGKYALASINYDPTTPFTIAATPNIVSSDNIERGITRKMLDTSVAQSPASISHKIYVMVGHKWNSMPVPVVVSLGGSYEFSQDNAALEGYELYLRAGASF